MLGIKALNMDDRTNKGGAGGHVTLCYLCFREASSVDGWLREGVLMSVPCPPSFRRGFVDYAPKTESHSSDA